MPTDIQINHVYKRLERAQSNYAKAAKQHERAKTELERKKLIAVASGEIAGKNDRERDAAALQKYADEYTNLDTLECTVNDYKLFLSLAQLEVDRVRLLMRLAELEAGLQIVVH